MNARRKSLLSNTGRMLAIFPFVFIASMLTASAQTTNLTTGFGPVQITLGTNNGPQDVDTGIKVLAVLTLLTLAPSIMLLMTCFTRIVICLLYTSKVDPLKGVGLLVIPPRLGLSLVDRMLGGPGKMPETARELSEIEVALVDQVSTLLAVSYTHLRCV